jgi:hypothetical protein
MFVKAASSALVKRVAEMLQKQAIPVMPLKGVLLQKLVYGDDSFRPISDVDLLVPETRFADACAELRRAGFTNERWQPGRWQVTLSHPARPSLRIDLHQRLTRTSRSRLTAAGMLERGTSDTRLFGAPVIVPCPEDLLAHLLLHATLDWLNTGRLHCPQDFEAVARALALDPDRCARHLAEQGLLAHARLMIPRIVAQADGTFLRQLEARLPSSTRTNVSGWLAATLAGRFPRPGHVARRLAGMALAPSLSNAIATAVRDRLTGSNPGRDSRS